MTKYLPPTTTTRLGETFKAMMQTCPGEVGVVMLLCIMHNNNGYDYDYSSHICMYHQIASYGKCVAANADSIERGLCEKEFQALRVCMRKVE